MEWWLLLLLVICLAPLTQKPPPRKARSDAASPPPTPGQPITTQTQAKAALRALLMARGYGRQDKLALSDAISEMALEMKEHAEELRIDIDYLREEIEKQKEYRNEIADEIECELEYAPEDAPMSEADAQDLAKTQRHLGHLDREIAQMQADLAKYSAALKAYRADRTAFVSAYADYTLNRAPNPNHGREKMQ